MEQSHHLFERSSKDTFKIIISKIKHQDIKNGKKAQHSGWSIASSLQSWGFEYRHHCRTIILYGENHIVEYKVEPRI